MRTRHPISGRQSQPPEPTPAEATVFRQVEVPSGEPIEELGSFRQSTDYDGTDVATADATTGYRVEAEGDAEFNSLRARGEVYATDMTLDGLVLIHESDGFEVNTEGWFPANCTATRVTTSPQSGVGCLELTATATNFSAYAQGIELDPTRPHLLQGWVDNVDGTYLDIVYYYAASATGAPVGDVFVAAGPKMAPGWNEFRVDLGTPDEASPFLRWGIADTTSQAVAGDRVRVDQWNIYRQSLLTGAAVYTADPDASPRRGVFITPSSVTMWPMASWAAQDIVAPGRMRSSASRTLPTGEGRPLTELVSPAYDVTSPDQARLSLYGGTDDESDPTTLMVVTADTTRFDGDVDMNGNVFTLDNEDINGDWVAYTPTIVWAGGGGDIGNAVCSGRYMAIGFTVHWYATITLGTTTTLGAGRMRIVLPKQCLSDDQPTGGAWAVDTGTQNYPGIVVHVGGQTHCEILNPGGGFWSPTVPFAWSPAAGDIIRVGGTYRRTH